MVLAKIQNLHPLIQVFSILPPRLIQLESQQAFLFLPLHPYKERRFLLRYLESARAGFAPFIYLDCIPGSHKALLDRTEADKKPVFSLRAGLGQNCKVEARCNLSNAIWGGMSIVAFIAAQLAIATVQPVK